MRLTRALLALLPLFSLACDASGHELAVDMRTDLRPFFDFRSVSVRIVEAPDGAPESAPRQRNVTAYEDFRTGRQLAVFSGLVPGTYVLRVELFDAASTLLLARQVVATLERTRTVTVVITSNCFGVACPRGSDDPGATECLDGRCVRPDCSDETRDGCGDGCVLDTDCAGDGRCTVGQCADQVCFQVPDDSRCVADSYCDVNDGCVSRPPEDAGPPPPDAGPVASDSGPLPIPDAGPISACPADGCDDSDPCTDDACVAGTCAFTPRCGDTEYCLAGGCQPDPTLLFETSGATPGCIDLGVAHASGSDFAFRRTITGRGGATAQQVNRQVSCGTPAADAERFTLDSRGNHQDTFYTAAVTECWDGIYGRWDSWVDVDGVMSNVVSTTYYNSRCSNVRTCTAARSFCSPCRTCDLSRNYCYSGTTCAPDPVLSITTSNGPGCVDLGQPHISPPALAFRVTGRPNAPGTQYNEHVSCGGARAAADDRSLDSSGTHVSNLETGALADCTSTIYGRWNVDVVVDGTERSNTVEVVYYNSGCPAVATCTAARSYCP